MNNQLIEQLQQLRLTGVVDMLKQQRTQPNTYGELAFEERLALLIDHEMIRRENNKITRLRKQAKLRLNAPPEQLSYADNRGISQPLMAELLCGTYLRHHQNVMITGATGSGKTFVACALGEQACQHGITTRYWRLSRLVEYLAIARADGSYNRELLQLSKKQLLIVDDWAMEKLNPKQAIDLLEVIEERHGRSSTIICSQLPVDQWHSLIANPTVADALLDRLIHNAHRIELKGDSMRKQSTNNKIT